MNDAKDEAHIDQPTWPQHGDIYQHYKGGLYSIVTSSVDEANPRVVLVTYHSNLKGQNWTRTLVNFGEEVSPGVKRFTRLNQ